MKLKICLITFIILGLSYSLFLIFIKDNPTTISQKEAESIVTNFYGGKVLKAKLEQEKRNYQLIFENDKGVYKVSVDSETKKISNIRLIEKKEALITIEDAKKNIEKELSGQVSQLKEIKKEGQPFVEATIVKDNEHYLIEYDLKEKTIVSNKEISSSVSNPPNISEQEAKDIALQQIKGEITNLSIVNTQNGRHYKVTVDDYSEGAHVYVQANTGKVSSISWYSEQQQPTTRQQPSNMMNDNADDENDDNSMDEADDDADDESDD
ncbi:PepSY domain-containing protein [Niallia oryzisoli]|uniref:PepSY domain-containing protein n=1 Tax=Niallia oryzisoli TaxID=1737571 RepID=A0ABZ2C7X4_9BACI